MASSAQTPATCQNNQAAQQTELKKVQLLLSPHAERNEKQCQLEHIALGTHGGRHRGLLQVQVQICLPSEKKQQLTNVHPPSLPRPIPSSPPPFPTTLIGPYSSLTLTSMRFPSANNHTSYKYFSLLNLKLHVQRKKKALTYFSRTAIDWNNLSEETVNILTMKRQQQQQNPHTSLAASSTSVFPLVRRYNPPCPLIQARLILSESSHLSGSAHQIKNLTLIHLNNIQNSKSPA